MGRRYYRLPWPSALTPYAAYAIYLARRLTHVGDTALRLAHFFGRSLEFWLNLSNLYGFSCFLLSDPQLAYTHVCNPSGNCLSSTALGVVILPAVRAFRTSTSWMEGFVRRLVAAAA